ncbi:ABC transporter ATP-binding protein [Nocardioides pantholopis]|uniref:ABC transporter ATP-binding protein n=1 Tax=Nocardioides pantholopis TaxID=2483798 RepID=UPI0013DE0360|nr:dipeptide/oligopeptide/nickel ABC transporter ATP-binding protein [Nocardioides pantholopis]
MTGPLLLAEGVTKVFKTSRWPATPLRTVAIDDVSLRIEPGESVGIAGESGSGKSTLIGAFCGLVRPDRGSIQLRGKDVYRGRRFDRRAWRSMQLVFQDPYTSLNPAMTVEQNVAEPLRFWKRLDDAAARRAARELLELVGLGGTVAERRPASLSGGQRQRVSIARALAAEPELLLLDESVSALDVSVQAQILELLMRVRAERDLTQVLVSHDISVLQLVCDRVIVMQAGRIVEECSARDLTVEKVSEPYTRQLLEAVPTLRAPSAPLPQGD